MYQEFFKANKDYDLRIMDINPKNPGSMKLHSEKLRTSEIWRYPQEPARAIFAKKLKSVPFLKKDIARLTRNVLSNGD